MALLLLLYRAATRTRTQGQFAPSVDVRYLLDRPQFPSPRNLVLEALPLRGLHSKPAGDRLQSLRTSLAWTTVILSVIFSRVLNVMWKKKATGALFIQTKSRFVDSG
jgi:hypothetical protein